MYGKIFDSIFKSTLVAEGGWLPTYIFMSMITIADKDGIVDYAPKSLYSLLGFRGYDSKITFDDFKTAIEYLEQEDEDSNSPVENGRRLVPLNEVDTVGGNRGWLVVNYLEYRKKASRHETPGASTERVRRWRERQRRANETACNGDETACNGDETNRNGHTDTDTDTDTDKRNIPPSPFKSKNEYSDAFEKWWKLYPRKVGKDVAYRSWKKIGKNKRATVSELTEAIINHVESDHFTHDGKECIPNPSTWLNQGRWKDEVQVATTTNRPEIPENPYGTPNT